MPAKRKPTTHWVWQAYSTDRGMAFATDIWGIDTVSRALLVGERLRRIPTLQVMEATAGRFRDMLGSYMGILIVARKLRRVLEEMPGARIQWVPITVPGHVRRGYSIANVLATVEAIDLSRSKFDVFEGTDVISRWHRVRLRSIPDTAAPIFHAAESPTLILICDALKQRLTAVSDEPGILTPAEDYRNEF